MKALSARVTNLALFVALLAAFATGLGAVATGSARGRWVVIAHGIAAIAIILLIPWKGRIVRAGLRRTRFTRWLSLVLALLTLTSIALGLGYSTGLVRSIKGIEGLWYHVAVALILVPLALWHFAARWQKPRRTDLSRRNLLRLSGIGAVATALYATATVAIEAAGLPGGRRRFTGSYERGSFRPAGMPATIWLDDSAPAVDPGPWRLTIVDGMGRYDLTLTELYRYSVSTRALIDCTSGWYAVQDWTGVPVTALLRGSNRSAKSLLVHSMTGYHVRLPVRDLDGLLLATQVGGEPLSRGHGYPLRLVAPGRRGFWWVKWVDRIELQDTPWWWQPPLPTT